MYKRAHAVANNHNEDLNAMELSTSLLRTLADTEKTGNTIAPAFNLPPDEDLNAMELSASLLRTQADAEKTSTASRHGDPLGAAATTLPLQEPTRRSLFGTATTNGEQPGGNS